MKQISSSGNQKYIDHIVLVKCIDLGGGGGKSQNLLKSFEKPKYLDFYTTSQL